uniref:Coiled-coil domain-containing protein 181 n=1 Tax=Leptobrachium leishanense TaxID=445787 RepID=A0A8C5P6F6_9ANUR
MQGHLRSSSLKMSENEDYSAGSQEYEDDFEKDLDWLINEDDEGDAGKQNKNGEKQSNSLKEDTSLLENEEKGKSRGTESPSDEVHSVPNSLEPVASSEEENFIDDEEAKRYIAEKIEQANKQLESESVDENRERKLKFKDNLVDLEVPPVEYTDTERSEREEEDVTDSLSKLHVSDVPQKENEHQPENRHTEEEQKDGKILVEKDGKFELVNLHDIENAHFLPSISNEKDPSKSLAKSQLSNLFGTSPSEKGFIKQKASSNNEGFYPKPPSQPKARPGSAANMVTPGQQSTRRVQSAALSSRNTTFSLSPEQKQLQKKIQERQERFKREEEERKKEMEENKRKVNEDAFKAWLQKKRDQLYEERRIQQAKQIEKMNITDEEKDPTEAFNNWLKRKQHELLKEKKIEELKKQESAIYLHDKEDCERAYTEWLRRKRIQKRVELQEAKERSRRLLMEARRAKQMHNLLYNISEAKSVRYTSTYN